MSRGESCIRSPMMALGSAPFHRRPETSLRKREAFRERYCACKATNALVQSASDALCATRHDGLQQLPMRTLLVHLSICPRPKSGVVSTQDGVLAEPAARSDCEISHIRGYVMIRMGVTVIFS